MFNKNIFYILICYFFISCNENHELGSILPITSIEPVKNIDWDIKSFEYIPLETHETILVSQIDKILANESYYYILDTKSNYGLFLFDKKGNFVRTISSKGKGPGEFIYITDFDIDKKGNSYLFDREKRKILKFDSLGVFIEEFIIDLNTANFARVNDNDFLFFQKGRHQTERKLKNDLVLWNRKEKIKSTYFPYSAKSIRYGSFSSFYRSGEKLYYCNFFGNNIYEIVDGIPQLVFRLDLGEFYPKDELFNNDKERQIVDRIINDGYYNNFSNYYETKDNITFRIDKGKKRFMCFLWKDKHDFYIVDLSEKINREVVTFHFSPSNIIGVDEDYFLTSMMPYFYSNLKKAKKKGFIEINDEQLNKIIETMDLNGNPIIIKFKFNTCYENEINSNSIAHID